MQRDYKQRHFLRTFNMTNEINLVSELNNKKADGAPKTINRSKRRILAKLKKKGLIE